MWLNNSADDAFINYFQVYALIAWLTINFSMCALCMSIFKFLSLRNLMASEFR